MSENSQTTSPDDGKKSAVGEQIGPYKVLLLLGEGLAADEEQKRRFTQEAKAASALNHPHILTIYDIGTDDGRSYIAMEFVEGETLRERLNKDQPLPVKLVLDIGVQIASALARAHDAGIIHRDLKPENIMLRPDGYIKILDFGLAKLIEDRRETRGSEAETILLTRTTPGAVIGTPRYMSPEQARGERLDHRSDIFSYGCVLHEIASGRPAFSGASLLDTLNSIVKDDPQPASEINADVPQELDSIIAKCLDKSPSDRYQRADDIEADLRRLRIQLESGETRASLASTGRGLKFFKFPLGRLFLILALYLVATFIITRIVKWAVGHYVMSPHLVDFASIAMLALIPAVALLASARGKMPQKKWRKARVIGIPANLVAAAALLFLLFHGKDLGAATKTILVENDEGQMVERVVPKSEFRKKAAIFFFDNQSGDASLDWLQYAVPYMMTYDLFQDVFLHLITGYDVYDKIKKAGFPGGVGVPLALKSKIAGNFEQAFKQCDDALKTSKTPQERMGVFKQMSSFYEDRGQMSKSLEYLNKMIAEVEQCLPPTLALIEKFDGLSKYVKAGKSDAALQIMKASESKLSGSPFEKILPLGYLDIYLEMGEADKAAKAIEGTEAMIQAFQVEILRPIIFSAQGRIHELKGEYGQAIESFAKQQELNPTEAKINTHIGRCYRNLKQQDKAEEHLQKTIKVFPFDPEAHYEIALVYLETGNNEKGLEHLKKAISVWKDADSQFEPARKAREILSQLEPTS